MDQKQFLDALLGLLAIDSVAWLDASEAAPYGSGPAKALDYVLSLCRTLGVRTENRGGRVAWAEIGAGDELTAVLGHLDVVPDGEGWTHDPRGELCGDRLYGRGAVDDKGPVLAALFAMKDLQDAKTPLRRRVRLIFGQCEESGDWEDMAYYRAHEELPVSGFTPDADFPVICGEKGILHYALTLPLARAGLRSAEGGDAVNMVPARAKAVALDGAVYTAEGVSAHASLPEKGENAIGKLMAQLRAAGVDSPLVKFYVNCIGMDSDGAGLGCAFSDAQSGALTVNPGLLRTEGDTVTLTLDIRCPVTVEKARVRAALEAACAPYGMAVGLVREQKSVYLDRNGPLIRALLSVYRDVTGDSSEPLVIGGGTYARAMPNIAAFGPMRPGRECTEHQRDEYILLDDLFTAREIYRRAIEKLANL